MDIWRPCDDGHEKMVNEYDKQNSIFYHASIESIANRAVKILNLNFSIYNSNMQNEYRETEWKIGRKKNNINSRHRILFLDARFRRYTHRVCACIIEKSMQIRQMESMSI